MRRLMIAFGFLALALLAGCYEKTTCCLVDGGCDAGDDMSADADADADNDADADAK